MLASIGHNNPPEPTAIERAEPHIEALRMFIAANPVLSTEDESRAAKEIHDRVKSTLDGVERERKAKVEPLNTELKAINEKYNRLHNVKGTGFWDNLLGTLKSRMTSYAIIEERKRFEAEEAARQAAAEAAERARAAAEAEEQAREMAAAGVCDAGLPEAMEAAETTSQEALRAMWTARRAEGQTKVRIAGGSGRAISLKDHETLHLTDWRAAIEEMSGDDGSIPQAIADAIITAARAYRKISERKQLPAGVEASHERGL